MRFEVLKKRADFLAAAKGRREVTPGFILQIRPRSDGDPLVRVGFTCSKKVGNAVARNRAKRRLREIARLDLPIHGTAGHDYVLIGRRETTASLPFETLRAHLTRALQKLGAPKSEAVRKG
ncbi:MAG: ribonuclease P protein component [Pseudomonadota bacterium]